MDPLDHARPNPDGTICAVCDEPVPDGAVSLLAWRDDLAFVQVDCRRCGSTSLGFILDAGTGDGRAAANPDARVAPVTGDDVLDMHRLLSGWQGGLRELLVGESDRPGAAS